MGIKRKRLKNRDRKLNKSRQKIVKGMGLREEKI